MTNIVQAIDLAHEANEKRIAAEIGAPMRKLDDDTEALLILRSFAGWCKSRGVKWLPAAPATCAAWIQFEAASKIVVSTILKGCDAIGAAHTNNNFANPIISPAVGAELERITKTKAPRSWPKAEQPLFFTLPPEVQQIVSRREEQNSLAIRNMQNKVAEFSKKGNLQCQPENKSTAASTDSPTTQPSS